METRTKIIIAVISTILILTTIFYIATPQGRAIWNERAYDIQKADDATNYETIKKVEDTCRAMIASYEADKLTYEQYKDSDNEEKQGWAEQAKMRANKTASSYNNYIIKNTFVWKDNVPADIYLELPVIE
jgi:hypothetical protein